MSSHSVPGTVLIKLSKIFHLILTTPNKYYCLFRLESRLKITQSHTVKPALIPIFAILTFDSFVPSSLLTLWPFLHLFHYFLTLCSLLLLSFHMLSWGISFPPRTVTAFYITVSTIITFYSFL